MLGSSVVSAADLLAYLSAAVAVLTVMLGLGGLFAFLSVRSIAAAEARAVAKEHASAIAESAAVTYLQEEIPAIIGQYMELARNAANDATADEIARQEGGAS